MIDSQIHALPCLLNRFIVFQRTWEDPTFIHPDAEGCRGDNDPLDVCEIGLKVIQPGVSSKNLNDSLIFL